MDMDEHLIEKEIKQNYVYHGRIINLRVDDVRLPDGVASKREYVEHRGGAAILAIDQSDYVYLVRQFRYPYREVIYEIPAGKLEEGEEAIVTARRELEEETGLVAEDIEQMGEIYPSPGYTNERLYIFLAKGLSQRSAHLDADEYLDVIRIPVDEAIDMVRKGVIKDAKTCYALLLLDRR